MSTKLADSQEVRRSVVIEVSGKKWKDEKKTYFIGGKRKHGYDADEDGNSDIDDHQSVSGNSNSESKSKKKRIKERKKHDEDHKKDHNQHEQKSVIKSAEVATIEDVQSVEWLFREGHSIYWGLSGRSRNALQGKLMIEFAAQKNNQAALIFCMSHGWNNQKQDSDHAQAMYEDMIERGYSHRLYLNPIFTGDGEGVTGECNATDAEDNNIVDNSDTSIDSESNNDDHPDGTDITIIRDSDSGDSEYDNYD